MHPHHTDAVSSKIKIPVNTVWLGALGVMPFAASSAVAVLASHQISARESEFALLVYGAVILSFLGGILWGRILAFGSLKLSRTRLARLSLVLYLR